MGEEPHRPRRTAGRDDAAVSWVTLLVTTATAVLLLGPALAPGVVARYDLSVVPGRPWSPELLGLGASAPRAVPSDLVAWLLSWVLPDDLVVPVLLLGLLVLAGTGASRWGRTTWSACIASVGYLWSVFLAERLGLGQWAVLLGWAAAPWAARAAARAVSGNQRAVLVAGLWVAVGALGGAPALVLVLGPALAVTWCAAAGRRAVTTAVLIGTALACALPWAVPALLRPGGTDGSSVGARVFAVRSDSPAGRVLSVLTGGGIWSADVVPPGRELWVSTLMTLVLCAVAVTFLVRSALRDRADRAILLAGVVGVVATFALSSPAGVWAQVHVPGIAVLRDPSRLVGWWTLAVAVGLARLGEELATPPRRWSVPACALVLVAPVASLPGAALGLGGRLDSVHYPAAYRSAARLADRVAGGGAVLVLPWSHYRAPAWNGRAPVVDPMTRFLGSRVVSSDDLPVQVGDRVVVVPGENRAAAAVGRALATGRPVLPVLQQLGVAAVVVDRADGSQDDAALQGLVPAGSVGSIDVYHVPGASSPPLRGDLPPTLPVLLGDALALAAVAGLVTLLATRSRRGPEFRGSTKPTEW